MATIAQSQTDPLGGKPPQGATCSIKDFDYQIKYQRAFEAVLWNMPAMRLYGPTEEINNKTFKLADIELVP